MLQESHHPSLGFGLGLRSRHMPHIFEHRPAVDWFEVISENYMDTGGKARRNLARIAEQYPIVLHGVALSIGTVDPLNSEYLTKLKRLIDAVQPAWVSDHLCWTGVAHRSTHDLLPVPYTEASLRHIVQRLREVQDFLERPIALENPSTYLEFKSSSMKEAEFIARMAEASGCQLLLDVNNVYVTCYNHRLDPTAYLDALPMERVIQIHLSGHTNKGSHIIDTHDDHVIEPVWELYRYAVQKAGRVPNTMIEWDDRIPEFPVLFAELEKARMHAMQAADVTMPAKPAEISAPVEVMPAVSLSQQQQLLQHAILSPAQAAAGAIETIRDKDGFPARDQLNVYIHAYRWRLYDIVAEDYPALSHYLGEHRFRSLVEGFIERVPSQHFNVARYAAQLPRYYESLEDADVVAMELCLLETAIVQLADAEETTALTLDALQGVTPDMLMEMQLHPRKALRLFAFAHDINGYYQAFQNGQDTPAVPRTQATFLAVFRHEDVVWRLDLDHAEYTMLSELFSGHTVAAVVAQLDEQAAAGIAPWFTRWMRHGLLAQPESLTPRSTQPRTCHETITYTDCLA